MQSALDEATDPWGVKVERVEVKDVRLPVHLQRAMATEAEAAREARAKVKIARLRLSCDSYCTITESTKLLWLLCYN